MVRIMKNILILIVSLIVNFVSFPVLANCDNMTVIATVIDNTNSFAIINANNNSDWKNIVRIGDKYNKGIIKLIRVEEVWISYGDHYCIIHRAKATDSYINWSSTFVDRFKELLFDYQNKEFLLNLVKDDLATLGLDGGRISNPEFWDDLNSRIFDINNNFFR